MKKHIDNEWKIENTTIENNFLEIIRRSIEELDENILSEDLDLLSKYIIVRFLKTYVSDFKGYNKKYTEKYTEKSLEKFIKDRFPFIVTFITVINSDPAMVDIKA